MTIKQKLISISAAIVIFLTGVLLLTINSFGDLSDGFLDVIQKSATGVNNSTSAQERIVVADQNLGQVSTSMLEMAGDIDNTNQQVRVLERKIKIASQTLKALTSDVESVIEEMPEDDTRYLLEDVNDAIGDIEERMRREALISLAATVNKMNAFTVGIGVQVEEVTQLSSELGEVKTLSKDVVSASEEIRTLAERFGGEIATSRNMIATVLSIVSVLAVIGALTLVKAITQPLNRAMEIAKGIAAGDLDQNVDITGNDEIGQLGDSMSVMIKNLKEDIESTRRRADEASRIRSALDVCNTNVVVADATHTIIYQNQASQETLCNKAESLVTEMEQLDADDFVGSKLYDFHLEPEQQSALLEQATESQQEDLKVGETSLRMTSTPVFNETGDRIGTALEWIDRTDEVAMENEVDQIVSSARSGDLTQRINEEGKHGFFKNLSTDINALIGEVGRIFGDLSTVMSAMADGNLTRQIDSSYLGSFETLKNDVNGTIDNLRTIIGQLRMAMNDMHTSATEISAGNNSLSARTEQQAASLVETASSMKELTDIVQNNTDNAQQANVLAVDARDKADHGGEIVKQAMSAMEEIRQSSSKISDIITVIDAIAFQTNLLALNAAVEAARAGDQGRGFAVVAQEVRELAGRSAEAAKEIKALIEDSSEKVEMGEDLVNRSGEVLVELVTAVNKVGDIVGEIAAASSEQLLGIQQVNNAVSSLEEGTQQNAALAEETSAAAISMTDKASDVNEMVKRFET